MNGERITIFGYGNPWFVLIHLLLPSPVVVESAVCFYLCFDMAARRKHKNTQNRPSHSKGAVKVTQTGLYRSQEATSSTLWPTLAMEAVLLLVFLRNRVIRTAKIPMPRLLAIRTAHVLFMHDVGGWMSSQVRWGRQFVETHHYDMLERNCSSSYFSKDHTPRKSHRRVHSHLEMIKQTPLLLGRNWLWQWLRVRASFCLCRVFLVACGNKSDKIPNVS